MMNPKDDETPIPGLPADFIYEHCQQSALDKATADTESLEAVLAHYCESTRRGLTLFTENGQPFRYSVSEVGSESQFWKTYEACLNYIERRFNETQAAEIETEAQDKTRH